MYSSVGRFLVYSSVGCFISARLSRVELLWPLLIIVLWPLLIIVLWPLLIIVLWPLFIMLPDIPLVSNYSSICILSSDYNLYSVYLFFKPLSSSTDLG